MMAVVAAVQWSGEGEVRSGEAAVVAVGTPSWSVAEVVGLGFAGFWELIPSFGMPTVSIFRFLSYFYYTHDSYS